MTDRPILALAVLAVQASAQLVAPNQSGVSIGHIHLYVHDIDAQQRFWTLLGGTPSNGRIELPGIYVVLRKQDPTAGSVGSVIDHIGFKIKDLNTLLPKMRAANVKIDPGTTPTRVFLTAPDQVKVEIIEDRSIRTPVAMHHIHMFLPDSKVGQAWYVKYFGAVESERPSGSGKNLFQTATVPGAEITITKKDGRLAPTKGRSLEHIGFEITDIDQFVKMLEAAGIQTEMGVHKSSNSDVRVAHITDPWGVRIELTEGLRAAPARSAAR